LNVELTNTEKVFFPETGITKGDLIAYYEKIADHILPFLKDRPLMMQRFPDGIRADGFYQKEAGDYFPDRIRTHRVKKEGGEVNHVVCNDAFSLIYLVNQGTVVFHPWLSRIDAIHRPDKLIIDLDPPGNDFEIVRQVGLMIFDFFDRHGITIFIMTTGSKGIHLMIPLDGKSDFDAVRAVATSLADRMVDEHGDVLTLELRKEKRNGKLFFDIKRNAYGQTAVAPYSVRPIEGAPVATPIDRDELARRSLDARSYTIKNVLRRLSQKKDPWSGYKRHAIGLDRLKKLG
jgi:bifunctional non-homologous end joining protein LigD